MLVPTEPGAKACALFFLRIMLSRFFLAADRMTGGYRHGFSNAISSDWIWRISRKTVSHLNSLLRLEYEVLYD